MVLEGGPHAFGLLCWSVGLLVPVQVIGVVLVTAWEHRGYITVKRKQLQNIFIWVSKTFKFIVSELIFTVLIN